MEMKIGVRRYNVVKEHELIEVGAEFYGRHSQRECEIAIADKFDQVTQNETFIHEILHAICDMQCLDQLGKDEHSIDLMAKGLYSVIVDNPHIFSMENV